MTARVLVVDDVPANVKLWEARLSAEYFDVVTAMSGKHLAAPEPRLDPGRCLETAWRHPQRESN
jgi:CheY-like chemotaxis protein